MTDSKPTTGDIEFRLADWTLEEDRVAVVELLDAYAHHPMGGAEPLPEHVRQHLPDAMANTPGAFSVLGWRLPDNESNRATAVALANCFTTLSTFACKPLVNIHDLYVADSARGTGAGQKILAYVEKVARARGCCKLTLEVLSGNTYASRSYENYGFENYTLDESTGHAVFMHKYIE